MTKRQTTDQFIRKARTVHGNTYDYSQVVYVNSTSKVDIICPTHGVFSMRPNDHINSKQGCRLCANTKKKITTAQFTSRAAATHDNEYDYSLVVYSHNKTPVDIICPKHGVFSQKPNDHLYGTGCPQCASNAAHTIEDFLTKATAVHGKRYDYSNVVYQGVAHKVEIQCIRHGIFRQTPDAHINQRQGCPHCRINNHSKEAIKWLEYRALLDCVSIQHAKNGGEIMIPNTPYKADGFCKESNTVYEFWGDFWHGNPEIYDAKQINRVKQKTFGELYNETLKKKREIIAAGYNLIDIWERQWYNISKHL